MLFLGLYSLGMLQYSTQMLQGNYLVGSMSVKKNVKMLKDNVILDLCAKQDPRLHSMMMPSFCALSYEHISINCHGV